MADDEELFDWVDRIYKKYGMNGMMERKGREDERKNPNQKNIRIEIPRPSSRERPGFTVRKYH